MNKISPQTPNLVDKNIDDIAKIFPGVVTEKEDINGNTVKSIDFELLKQELSKNIVDGGAEKYTLNWPGKKRSLLKANTPISKTLRPVREDSVNFDTTENLYIEGDNFEALKILQESYLGKVKMIYIDPPYNTGKDFVYKDNFKMSKEKYDEETESIDEEGNKLFKENSKTNPRFHSDWLSMMYERLIIARDLLREDGVIFISIDDNEVANLRKICDEIFGEENFLTVFIWEKGKEGGNDSKVLRSHYESIMCYVKDASSSSIINLDEKDKSRHIVSDKEPNLVQGIVEDKGVGEPFQLINLSKQSDYVVRIPLVSGEILEWPSYAPQRSIDSWIRDGKVFVGVKKVPYVKSYYKDELQGQKPSNIITQKYGTTKAGSIEIRELFGNKDIFTYPKPSILIKRLLSIGSTPHSIVMDFFSGSATTAHSVMQLNNEDGGNRKYILVQLSEETKEDSEAFKAGYKNICEIGKERIRRAGKKILDENIDKENISKLDIGFRVYRVDDTNMVDVAQKPSETKQESLLGLVENIKPDRSAEDLLTEVMLHLSLELSLPISQKEINYKKVYFVQENSLVACFENEIDEKVIEEIASSKPLKAVFKDSSFKNDEDRINLENKFKVHSPETEISVI